MIDSWTKTLLLLAAISLLGGCNDSSENPTEAQRTYGERVDIVDAIPAPAVAAEPTRYRNRRVTVDGRIAARGDNGCTVNLDTENGPLLRIEAIRSENDTCTWQVPTDLDGIAAATGTLHVDGDSLRLSANGVQVTPVQVIEPDS